MGCVIGVDVGSQSVKAVVADDEGRALATASAPCTMRHPAGGWAEQDPSDWTRALTAAVRQARTSAGLGRDDITMLGLACQVDGLVALDKDLRPVRPAIIWLDRRATDQSAALADAVGEPELVGRTGLNPDASHVAPKAMWLRDVEPDNYAATRWLASAGAHMNGWLTGEVAHDHAHASSTLLYDLRQRDWSDDLVGHAGLDAARLPAIHPAGAVLGTLRGEIADALGLSRHCRVIVGTGDDHAGALGAGALAPGVIVDVTGTAEPVAVPSREAVLDDERMIETHAHAVDEMLLIENPGFVSGGSTRWWAATQGIPQAELFGLAALAPPGSRRRALPPHALGLDRAALERPHARVLRGARAQPRRRAPGARGARRLRVRAARHRGPLRRARARGRRDPRRRRRRALEAVAADQGRCHGPPGAGGAERMRDEHRRGDARRASPTAPSRTCPRPPRRRSSWPRTRSRPRPEHRAVYDESYGAYRRLFDGVEGAL